MNLLRIPYDRGVLLVPPEQIIRIESMSNYSKIYFTGYRPMVVAKVLCWFEERLPQQMFARVHRSHLVNRLFVKETDENNIILLSNGEKIAMSRRKKIILAA
ncbi:MAG: LytTR family DNA-binding domain-containing protein [Ferruginibacter sp.]